MKRWFLTALAVWWFVGCGGGLQSEDGRPVAFKAESTVCPQCHMPLKGLRDSAEYIAPNGAVTVFDDPGCMVLWLQKKGIDPRAAKLYVYTRDTKRWIEASAAHYSRTDVTPMGYGFAAYEKPASDRVGFDTMRLSVLRGLTLKDPKIRKKLLGY